MSLKDRKKELQTLGRKSRTLDMGMGDGPETIWFRELSFDERQKLFGTRMKETTNKDGVMSLAFRPVNGSDVNFQAELVAKTLIDEDKGAPMFTLEELRKFRAAKLQKLYDEAIDVVSEFQTDEEKAADEPNPSTGEQT